MEWHEEPQMLVRFAARQHLRNRILGLLPNSPSGIRGDGPNAPFLNDVAPLEGEDEDQSGPMNACLMMHWRGANDSVADTRVAIAVDKIRRPGGRPPRSETRQSRGRGRYQGRRQRWHSYADREWESEQYPNVRLRSAEAVRRQAGQEDRRGPWARSLPGTPTRLVPRDAVSTPRLPVKKELTEADLAQDAEATAPIAAAAAGSTGPLTINSGEISVAIAVYSSQQEHLASQVGGAAALPDPMMYIMYRGAVAVLN